MTRTIKCPKCGSIQARLIGNQLKCADCGYVIDEVKTENKTVDTYNKYYSQDKKK